jgi:hypothetical protein
VFFTGSTASDIAVNSALYNADNPMLNNPRLIAAAQSLFDPGGPNESALTGDGSNALAIADLSGASFSALNERLLMNIIRADQRLGNSIESYEHWRGRGTIVTGAAIRHSVGIRGDLDEELVSMITDHRVSSGSEPANTNQNRFSHHHYH